MKTSTFIIGLSLILFGEIAFLANLGYVSWGFLNQIAKFWPVGIILIGLGLMFGNRIPRWLTLVITITMAIFIGIYAWISPNPVPYSGGQSEIIVETVDYQDVVAGDLKVKFGGGTLSVGLTDTYLVYGHFDGIGANRKTRQRDNVLNIDLKQTPVSFGPGINKITNNWDIRISPQLPWDIAIDAGAVKGEINLINIPLKQLNLKLGAGDVFLALGNNGESARINVEAGASEIKIQVPEDAGVKVKHNSAIANSNLNQFGWARVDKYYISPGYEEASAKVDIELSLGVANFQLEIVPAAQ